MKIVHRIVYEEDDIEMKCDPLREELFLDNNLVLEGDWYHDNISEQIQGFIKALDSLKLSYTLEINKCNENYT